MNTTLPTAAYDNKIYAKFSKNTVEKKLINKSEFQKEFSLIKNEKTMLLGITIELTQKNGCELLVELLPGIAALDLQLAIRGVGTSKFQEVILDFAESNPGKITILEDDEDNIRKIYAASDVSLFFTNNQETKTELKNSLAYASLPIAPNSLKNIAEDYNPNLESGNSFLYNENNIWSAFAAIVRANEQFRFPYDWKVICRNALDSEN